MSRRLGWNIPLYHVSHINLRHKNNFILLVGCDSNMLFYITCTIVQLVNIREGQQADRETHVCRGGKVTRENEASQGDWGVGGGGERGSG